MSDKSRMQTIHLSPYVSVQGTAEELARQYPPLPDEGDRVANLRNRVEMRQIMDDQLTVLVPLGELRAVFAVLDSLLPNVQQLQVARDAAEAREQALLSTYDAERKAMVENVALRVEVARLRADLDWLKRSIFGSANYHPCLLTGNFAEMAQTTEAARVGALARADAAEAEVARLTAELTALRAGQDALVAAVCDVAASMIEDNMRHAAELGREIWPIPDIRAMTPAAATAALDAKLRAERNKALRDAADRTLGLATGHECRNAILAMIEPEEK